jgi:hypothetical protein
VVPARSCSHMSLDTAPEITYPVLRDFIVRCRPAVPLLWVMLWVVMLWRSFPSGRQYAGFNAGLVAEVSGK